MTPSYQARFSDGRSAGSTDAGASLTTEGVRFVTQRGETRLWPYASLASAEPLTEHAIDALLTSSDDPGATLFVTEGAFARKLATLAPHLTARAQRWRSARPWIAGSLGFIGLSLALWAADISPARTVAGWIPDRVRTALGEEAVASMTEGKRVCNASAGIVALDRLVSRLSAAAGGGSGFKVSVVDWSITNAFATPGERIIVSRALIEKAAGPDEVAGVIAHEMGHGLERHPETALVRAIGLSAALQLMMGGSGGTVTNAGLMLAQLSYSRRAEREADDRALGILREAKIAPKGLGDFFRRVAGEEGEEDDTKEKTPGISGLDILRTHPQTAERRRVVDSQKPYPSSPALSSEDWAHLRAICDKSETPTDI